MGDKIDDKILRYMNESKDFEDAVRSYFTTKYKNKFNKKEILIFDLKRQFDLVSEDSKWIGEIKYYKNNFNLYSKFSSISEYVWILENLNSENKFIVFGGNKQVPLKWVSKFRSLVKDVKIYFFDGMAMEELL